MHSPAARDRHLRRARRLRVGTTAGAVLATAGAAAGLHQAVQAWAGPAAPARTAPTQAGIEARPYVPEPPLMGLLPADPPTRSRGTVRVVTGGGGARQPAAGSAALPPRVVVVQPPAAAPAPAPAAAPVTTTSGS